MTRWSQGRLQLLGYLLGALAALMIGVVATQRPSLGPALLVAAVLLVLAGGVAIWLAQARGGRT